MGEMIAEFYHRWPKRLSDDNVRTLISSDLAPHGLVVDRLKTVKARRHGKSYWHYAIPVRQVAA